MGSKTHNSKLPSDLFALSWYFEASPFFLDVCYFTRLFWGIFTKRAVKPLALAVGSVKIIFGKKNK